MSNEAPDKQHPEIALDRRMDIDTVDKLILGDLEKGIADVRGGRVMSMEKFFDRLDERHARKLREITKK